MLYLRELLVCFFVGGVPTIISYIISNSDEMVKSLSSLVPSDEAIYYTFILLILHVAIYSVNRMILRTSSFSKLFSSAIHAFSHDVGFSIHGIYRAITGAIPTAVAILIYQEGWQGSLPVTTLSVIFCSGTLCASLFLCWLQKATKPREKFL